MIRPGHPPTVLQKYPRPATKHIVYEGEAVGAILGMHLIGEALRWHLHAGEIPLSLDNTTFIKALDLRAAHPGKYLVDVFINAMDKLSEQIIGKDYKLMVRWISGHSGAEGNEMADEEVKWATQGNSSNTAELPEALHGTLPDRVSAIQQAYSATLLPRWKERWKTSPRYMKLSRIDLTLPSDKFFKAVKSLLKAVASLLTQLQTGIPLNKHLHKISATESLHCQHCLEVPKTVMTCPCYCSQRHQLRQELGQSASSLPYLLTRKKAIPTLSDL